MPLVQLNKYHILELKYQMLRGCKIKQNSDSPIQINILLYTPPTESENFISACSTGLDVQHVLHLRHCMWN